MNTTSWLGSPLHRRERVETVVTEWDGAERVGRRGEESEEEEGTRRESTTMHWWSHLSVDVSAVTLEILRRPDLEKNVEIPRRAALGTRIPLLPNTQAAARVHTRRDRDHELL